VYGYDAGNPVTAPTVIDVDPDEIVDDSVVSTAVFE